MKKLCISERSKNNNIRKSQNSKYCVTNLAMITPPWICYWMHNKYWKYKSICFIGILYNLIVRWGEVRVFSFQIYQTRPRDHGLSQFSELDLLKEGGGRLLLNDPLKCNDMQSILCLTSFYWGEILSYRCPNLLIYFEREVARGESCFWLAGLGRGANGHHVSAAVERSLLSWLWFSLPSALKTTMCINYSL